MNLFHGRLDFHAEKEGRFQGGEKEMQVQLNTVRQSFNSAQKPDESRCED